MINRSNYYEEEEMEKWEDRMDGHFHPKTSDVPGRMFAETDYELDEDRLLID